MDRPLLIGFAKKRATSNREETRNIPHLSESACFHSKTISILPDDKFFGVTIYKFIRNLR